MSQGNEIKSEKILLRDVFSMWFRIPEYQRPYVWGYEQIHDLLDDLTFAATNKPDSEYFLGSLVFQFKSADKSKGQDFDENDLLDGQQRLTTLVLLLAVLRDLSENLDLKNTCQKCIYQKEDKFVQIPERFRMLFLIRREVREFIEKFLIPYGGISDNSLEQHAVKTTDVSVRNMIKAISTLRTFLMSPDAMPSGDFLTFCWRALKIDQFLRVVRVEN